MTESDLQRLIQTTWSQTQGRLFRNNCGVGWVGTLVRVNKTQPLLVGPGDVLLKNARPLHAGLCEGSSDLIGWRLVTVTPEMVGKQIAQFAAVEVKSKTGRPTEMQAQFLHVVENSGGYAVLAKKLEDLK